MRVKTITVLTADTVALGVTLTGFLNQTDANEMTADFVEVTGQENANQSSIRIPSDAAVGDVFTISNQAGASTYVFLNGSDTFIPGDSIGAPGAGDPVSLPNKKILKVECVGSSLFSAYLVS